MKIDNFSKNSSGKVLFEEKGKASYYYFLPDPLPPKLVFKNDLLFFLSEVNYSIGKFSGLLSEIRNSSLLIKPMMRKEAVLSSQIEGTQSNLRDLYMYESDSKSKNLPQDVNEVSNYLNAMEYGLKRLNSLPISTRLIKEIHKILLTGDRGQYCFPGEFRKTQNWIGRPGCTLNEAEYVPPAPYKISECLNSLEKFIHYDDSVPVLIKLAMIHYQFEAIHPFIDGNGRVGRLLITLLKMYWKILPKPGLYMSEYFESKRSEYYQLLKNVSFNGKWIDWISFFLNGLKEQSERGINKITQLKYLQNKWTNFLRDEASSLPLRLIDKIFDNPIISIPTAVKFLGVTYLSAKRTIDTLCAKNILVPLGNSKYGKKFLAKELLDLIENRE